MSAGSIAEVRNNRTELLLARTALLAVGLLAAPVLGVAWWSAGTPGVRGAAAGLALVLVLFGAAALAQAWAVPRGSGALFTVVGLGLGVRLAAYLLALQWLSGVDGLHRGSLALATAAGFVMTLGFEMAIVARTPQFFWVRTAHGNAMGRN